MNFNEEPIARSDLFIFYYIKSKSNKKLITLKLKAKFYSSCSF